MENVQFSWIVISPKYFHFHFIAHKKINQLHFEIRNLHIKWTICRWCHLCNSQKSFRCVAKKHLSVCSHQVCVTWILWSNIDLCCYCISLMLASTLWLCNRFKKFIEFYFVFVVNFFFRGHLIYLIGKRMYRWWLPKKNVYIFTHPHVI